MMFENKRYLTRGVNERIPFLTQLFLWQCIADMPEPKDYLQVFHLSATEQGMQRIVHTQEQPDYRMEYVVTDIEQGSPVEAKVYVIDEETHSTMLLAEEY